MVSCGDSEPHTCRQMRRYFIFLGFFWSAPYNNTGCARSFAAVGVGLTGAAVFWDSKLRLDVLLLDGRGGKTLSLLVTSL